MVGIVVVISCCSSRNGFGLGVRKGNNRRDGSC